MCEGTAERGRCLHSWKRDLSDAVAVSQAKDSLDLIERHVFLNFDYVAVKGLRLSVGKKKLTLSDQHIIPYQDYGTYHIGYNVNNLERKN